MTKPLDDTEFDLEAGPEGEVHPFQRLARVFAAIGTVWIFLLMFLIVADVIGRNFLDKPITGVAEFAGRSVVAIVFLQLAAAVGAGRMTRSDFLIRIIARRSVRAVMLMEIFFSLCGTLLFASLAFISWPELMSAWRGNEFFGVQGVFTIPLWPFKGLLVAGSAMAALAYLVLIPALWREPRKSLKEYLA